MSKRNLMLTSWENTALLTGEDKAYCLNLGALTGLSWVCERITLPNHDKVTVYVVKDRLTATSTAGVITFLNDQFWEGRSLFAPGGVSGQKVSIMKPTLLGHHMTPCADLEDMRKKVSALVSDHETKDLLNRCMIRS